MSFYIYFWIGLLVSITINLIRLKAINSAGAATSRPVFFFQFVSMILVWPLIVAYFTHFIYKQIKSFLELYIDINRKFWAFRVMTLAYRICPQEHRERMREYINDYSNYIIADFDKKKASIDAKSKP